MRHLDARGGKQAFSVATLAALLILFGWLPPRAAAQLGFFHVEQSQGVWWLYGPNDDAMLSIGVDHVAYRGDQVKGGADSPYLDAVKKIYPDETAWDFEALARLRRWNFNTLGAWSDPELFQYKVPYTLTLDIAANAGADWQHGVPVDVYSPKFAATAQEIATEACIPRAGDHWLIGYYSDNELRWGADWRGRQTMLEMYLAMPAGAPGREHAVAFLRRRYRDSMRAWSRAWLRRPVKNFDDISGAAATPAYQADAAAFLSEVAQRYFQVCADAIHQADPNHLYLGARFSLPAPDAALAAARIADVVSVNIYGLDPRPEVKHIYQLTGKPVLVTEFAFRAADSGLPNRQGAGPIVANEAARGRAYAEFVARLESLPEAIGYHWFEWADEPAQGRFDGEDSNYGLVNIHDQPYAVFVAAVKQANAQAVALHNHALP